MQLFTEEILAKLKANGEHQARVAGSNHEIDFFPVVKIFNPYGSGRWLLTEISPDDPDIAFGLCDLGLNCPELGYVSIKELLSIDMGYGLKLERDESFTGAKPISVYARDASVNGFIDV